MFSIGDYVLNQNTGHIGKVVGYGHEIFDNVYTTTLKVLLTCDRNSEHKGIVEDLISNWKQYQSESASAIAPALVTDMQKDTKNPISQAKHITAA
ncbi:hypothetical protein [Chroococcidiopsis sp. TS-821]|uniref:hypothetical protein n=1 Tax=Chroococcidiopsis sp. TS-821 TaxID=1378066 RepID=UPI000D4B5EE2|nr:hypothetical protein [Chroococcidiopsis sp. TS-821]PPS39643.1 hypothetical protein B1A85_22375 [Chroococcidiopsis sp. TS-821]